MNGSIVWPLLAFVVGATVGIVVGFKTAGSDYTKRITQLLDENDQLLCDNEFLNDQIMALTNDKEPGEGEPHDDASLSAFRKLAGKYHLDSTSSGPPIGNDETVGDGFIKDPYEISEEEYEEKLTKINSESLMYYTVDRVLADENDEVVKNPISLVGAPLFEYLGIATMDTERVYVHNDMANTNFEIVIEHGISYRRDVLGAIDDDEEITDYEEDYGDEGPSDGNEDWDDE